MRSARPAGLVLTLALAVHAGPAAAAAPVIAASAAAASATGAPVAVHQTSDRNASLVIQQRSSVVNIDRSRTVTQGATTVTEVVRVGPDPGPAIVTQAGRLNRAITYQEGSAPRFSLRQSGGVDLSRTVQREIP